METAQKTWGEWPVKELCYMCMNTGGKAKCSDYAKNDLNAFFLETLIQRCYGKLQIKAGFKPSTVMTCTQCCLKYWGGGNPIFEKPSWSNTFVGKCPLCGFLQNMVLRRYVPIMVTHRKGQSCSGTLSSSCLEFISPI